MKKINFFSILFLLAFVGCTFKPHRSDTSPSAQANGNNQVKVSFHSDDKIQVGAKVGAYSRHCRQQLTTKGFERTVCGTKLFGEGIITKILVAQVALVEFDSAVEIDDTTMFEVK